MEWKALYFIENDYWKPRFGLVPLWNMKDMNLQTHYIDRWSEKLDISSEKTTEPHIWTCAPLKYEEYEPANSFEFIGRVKSSIYQQEPLLEPIFGLVPLWNMANIKPTDSSYNDLWSENLYISSGTMIKTQIWNFGPLKHGEYEPADSFEFIGEVKSSIFHREQ